jgi:hypothetical protein
MTLTEQIKANGYGGKYDMVMNVAQAMLHGRGLDHPLYTPLSGHEACPLGRFNSDSPIFGQTCSINAALFPCGCDHRSHAHIRNWNMLL